MERSASWKHFCGCYHDAARSNPILKFKIDARQDVYKALAVHLTTIKLLDWMTTGLYYYAYIS